MQLPALIEFARKAGYQPMYDPPSDELQSLLEELRRHGHQPKPSMPGNDQHSHAIEIEERAHVFKIYLRFDLRLCSAVAYGKSGSSRSFCAIDAESHPVVGPIIERLAAHGLEFLSHADGQLDLGTGPLEQGHVSPMLFAYLFEDP